MKSTPQNTESSAAFAAELGTVQAQVQAAYARLRAVEAAHAHPANPVRRPLLSILRRQAA
jgi:hypothetical protein